MHFLIQQFRVNKALIIEHELVCRPQPAFLFLFELICEILENRLVRFGAPPACIRTYWHCGKFG